MRPQSVKLFEISAWTAVGAAIVYCLTAIIQANSYRVPIRGDFLNGLIIIGVLAVAAGLFAFLTARKRWRPGRWIYLVVALIFGALELFALISVGRAADPLQLILLVAQVGGLAASLVFLFMPGTGAWLSGRAPAYPGYGGYPPAQGGYPPHPQQGGGYPPQPGQGYPPQGGYPPPQHGGYPPQQQGGYPPQGQPQQGGYPPQQGDNPQQQQGYPPQQGQPNPGDWPPPPGGYPPR